LFFGKFLSMKKFFIALFSLTLLLSPVALVHAQFDTSLTNLNKAVGPGTKPNLNGDIATSISTVVSAILGILGTIFFVLTVYAGVKWMLARGDEGEIEKAKEIIKAAVIGLVVTLAAYAITYFIGTRLTRAVSPSSPGNDAVLGCCVNADHSVCAANSKQSDCSAGASWQSSCPADCKVK
jgi:hypothetical protein